jgi:hypothetical protein
MPRPSLTAALANLADLRRLRKSLDAERSARVRSEDRQLASILRQINVDRLNVDQAIRDAEGLVSWLLAERVKTANPRGGS